VLQPAVRFACLVRMEGRFILARGTANDTFTGTKLALLCSCQRSSFTDRRLPASIPHDRSRSWIETSMSFLGNHGC